MLKVKSSQTTLKYPNYVESNTMKHYKCTILRDKLEKKSPLVMLCLVEVGLWRDKEDEKK